LEAKKSAEEEVKNTVFDAEDKAKKEAESIAKQSDEDVKSLKDKAMANVDEAASTIVKNIL
jgi:V/A-type H+-transporting ATPase subunit G/H